ncbi:asparagine synthetase B [Bacteroidota bacterium]|nr:asparagine synthetase B [Bacteroidota bacterium]
MCGISGIVCWNGKKISVDEIIRMNNSLRHRGPDDEGFLLINDEQKIIAFGNDTPSEVKESRLHFSPSEYIEKTNSSFDLLFGHRRLSIIDTSASGHQPMCLPDVDLWITYNGEIYNYKELRATLQAKGIEFNTESDTEVILRYYQAFGNECVQHFNGMWSFVIYDGRKKELFASRDRFGVKPFYYHTTENNFAFASEHKALLQFSEVKKEINPVAMFDFLALNVLEKEEEGLFKGIKELFPAHNLLLNLKNGELKISRYYSLKSNSTYSSINEKQTHEYIDEVKKLVTKSIDLRLRADVTVGTCLSGGIDSSVIVCAMDKLLNGKSSFQTGNKIETFSSIFPGSKLDESTYMKNVVEQTNTNWHTVTPNKKDFINDVEHLMYSHDLPIWSISSFAQSSVMKLAKANDVKVLLDGQGADELFGGYKHYYKYLLNDLKSSGEKAAYQNALAALKETNGKDFLLRYNLKKIIEPAAPLLLKKFFFPDLKYIHPDLLNQYKERFSLLKETSVSLNEKLKQDFTGTYLNELLRREDRNGMMHSVESRVPFTDDHALVESVFSIQGNYKIKGASTKYLLREAFKDILPAPVYSRTDKLGFVTPNNDWMNELKTDFKDYFTNDLVPYLNLPLLMKDYNTYFNQAQKPENYRTFKFMSLAVWMKVFF